ncbi:MAG: bifunctional riboflavin kinase/FAD synthetase [Desulfarculales bacterium]|jgi:riboflavin kinase/FMN adenylyltransferase|nr:bifunctional riboflavin kinase/FAD synthetase [Desulfarculales bacterium]
MQVCYNLEQIPLLHTRPAVSVGNFDGVHVGHQALIKALVAQAAEASCPAAAVIFNPHPLALLRPQRQVFLITPLEARIRLLEDLGVDIILCLSFDQALAALSPHDFVGQILVRRLRARWLYEGYNFNFGRSGKGNIALLRQLGDLHDFQVEQVEPVMMEGAPVSSSRVRQAVAGGDLSWAAQLLGRPYRLWGRVVRGAGRGGKLLGMPTANLEVDGLLLPPPGVYAARAGLTATGRVYSAVFNLGLNPTFSEINTPRLEAHLLDFSDDIYGQEIWVEPARFLRPEKKYERIDLLKEQMSRDRGEVRKLLADKDVYNPEKES